VYEHLAIYHRKRDPRKISDMVKLADTYLYARLHRDGKDKKGKMFTNAKPVHVDMRESGKSSADGVYMIVTKRAKVNVVGCVTCVNKLAMLARILVLTDKILREIHVQRT